MTTNARCEKQRAAKERWLADPEVLERQRLLGRQRAERQRERKRAAKAEGKITSVAFPAPVAVDPDRVAITTSVSDIRAEIQGWRLEWGRDSDFSREFHRELERSKEYGSKSVDRWMRELDDHVRHGRDILTMLKNVDISPFCRSPTGARDIFFQCMELTHIVLTEVTAISVKLDEYAPPTSNCAVSNARSYTLD
ncbi:hypothetical protein CONPUDRAFT_152327 [Coniophora puteana RWD-64-598 SS2]|uniref:Uncharacterized protein n=1 Tax=Coniophora puteana (strain RWD-64-598) TaxID=741705 RepID=A0A5M3MVW5_CONPW|nr:uncharacterized protein CONPUDRAFT_152327 [Coniophora puteana RWD-64-598 SS2]EIW83302.1 hypothetical protein CONPUDRAFT_152327 [Coniophora puteana RWD-64-598 SS2]